MQKKYQNSEIFSYLKNRKGVYWSSRIGGKYDLLVVLFVKDFEEYDEFIEDFNKRFPGLIKDIRSNYAIDHYIYKHKYLSKDYSNINYGYNDPIIKIDDLDTYILNEIKDNCRKSSLDISRKRRISYKTVINRIKEMETKRIILGYRMFLKSNDDKAFVVIISFSNYSRNSEKNIISYLNRVDSVTQTIRLFGRFNLFLHIRAKNYEEIQNMMIDIRDRFQIIDSFEIIPVFEDISINIFPM